MQKALKLQSLYNICKDETAKSIVEQNVYQPIDCRVPPAKPILYLICFVDSIH